MPASKSPTPRRTHWKRVVLWCLGLGAAAVVCGALIIGVTTALVLRELPDVSTLSNYQPKLPLRIYTADGVPIGEFGEERRRLMRFDAIPRAMKDAVLAAEDSRFYQHGGVDLQGVLRAVWADLGGKRQGASTITMQVARNVYLSSEQTFKRKFYELLLTTRLEDQLTKDQIFEIYLNQIYLGNRAYGFAAACQTYFGKPLEQITVAEAAMLAGLPKAPSANNPLANPKRARSRQQWIIGRMEELGYITPEEATQARAEPLRLRDAADPKALHAEYVAEAVRQQIVAQFGDSAYTRGLNVYTTLTSADQQAAYAALRKGVMDYEQRQPYRGPEVRVELPAGGDALDDAVDSVLADHPDDGELIAAVVTQASDKKVSALRANGDAIEISGNGLRLVRSALAAKAPAALRISRGSVIRLLPGAKDSWSITQMPEVEGAFVSMDPRDGSIRSLVGGFDFGQNKFNHVTQAWRQPGSSFKPFIYSAALDKGFMTTTMINDAPLHFDSAATGGAPWDPKNYEGTFEGPMTLRAGLTHSKNLVTIRILDAIGVKYAQDWITRFGFEADKNPAYLTMSLGSGAVTPMQMATAYSVFANGGYRVAPILVRRITDNDGQVLMEAAPATLDESNRAISARNAFLTSSLLHSVVRNGTGSKAYAALKRDDLYGKTGTTNDSFDAWFTGFQPTRVAVAWVGYDTPRRLGTRGETGASAALPIWIDYMRAALSGVPVEKEKPAPGLIQQDGEWYYDDFTPGYGVASVGIDNDLTPLTDGSAGVPPEAVPQERSRILDLFR